MIVLENLRIALSALRANKMRSVLTTLGIVIGVAAVIAVVSIVQGLQQMITGQLEDVGTTFIVITPRQQFSEPGVLRRPVELTWEDGLAIGRRVRNVDMITPQIIGNEEVRYRDRSHRPYVLGVNADWPEVHDFAVERGRFFSRLDIERRNKVAVVGRSVVEELDLAEPIGGEITIGNLPVIVVGIMEEKGRSLGFDYDDMVFIPFDTALSVFGRDAGDQVQLRLHASSSEDVPQVEDDIEQLLRQRHDIPEGEQADFEIQVQDEMLETFSRILGSVTAVVGAVVGVALIVGGIGIMNIMLVSVTERTREIGLRKAVGARRRDILVQFLVEAVVLSLLGGAIGIALGYGIGALAVQMIPGDLPAAHVPLWAVALAFGFCSAVGIGFGIYPAGKAARLDPIDALRYE